MSETGVDLAGKPAVEGLRVHTGSYGVVDLTVEQAAELGLPPGGYRIQGVVQRHDGGLAELPDVQTLRVAVRWLHPLDQPRPPHSHRDLTGASNELNGVTSRVAAPPAGQDTVRMARVHHVRAARERRNPDGSLKPNLVCELDGKQIHPGDGYQWVALKTGPRTGLRRIRCQDCPTWQPYELSTALWARLEALAVALTAALDQADDAADVQDALDTVIGEIQELAEEKRQAAENIEDGFGHATTQSDELADIADQLENWAQDFEDITVPEQPEPVGEHDVLTAEQLASWRQDVTDAVAQVLQDVPG